MVPIYTKEFISQEGEIGEKFRARHSFQNASISQRRTSQMVRRSPTADERRIYVLPQHCENILLVFQLGDGMAAKLNCTEVVFQFLL